VPAVAPVRIAGLGPRIIRSTWRAAGRSRNGASDSAGRDANLAPAQCPSAVVPCWGKSESRLPREGRGTRSVTFPALRQVTAKRRAAWTLSWDPAPIPVGIVATSSGTATHSNQRRAKKGTLPQPGPSVPPSAPLRDPHPLKPEREGCLTRRPPVPPTSATSATSAVKCRSSSHTGGDAEAAIHGQDHARDEGGGIAAEP